MAVRQYIGARYVPIFYENSLGGNNWESGVQYEPLTIVTYLNQSYTSKKTVPTTVGNPADNSEYWAITGGYNSQVAQLAQDVADLEENVDGWKKPKIVSIGASINLSVTGQLSGGFPDAAFAALGMTEGTDYYNTAIGGSGFTTGSKTFTGQLDDAIADLSDDFKNAPVRIIVTGGINNDINGGSTYLDAVDAFVAKAKLHFPHSTIEFLPLSWSRQHSQRVLLQSFYNTYIKQMPAHGVALWPEFYAYMHNYTDWFRDNIHFSQTGTDVMTRNFVQVITGTGRDFNPHEGLQRPANVTNVDATWTEIGTFTSTREYYDGKDIYFYGGDSLLKPAAETTIPTNPGSALTLGDNTFHYLGSTPTSDGVRYGDVPCYIRNAAGTEEVPAFLFVDTNNKLKIYAFKSITLSAGYFAVVRFATANNSKDMC